MKLPKENIKQVKPPVSLNHSDGLQLLCLFGLLPYTGHHLRQRDVRRLVNAMGRVTWQAVNVNLRKRNTLEFFFCFFFCVGDLEALVSLSSAPACYLTLHSLDVGDTGLRDLWDCRCLRYSKMTGGNSSAMEVERGQISGWSGFPKFPCPGRRMQSTTNSSFRLHSGCSGP